MKKPFHSSPPPNPKAKKGKGRKAANLGRPSLGTGDALTGLKKWSPVPTHKLGDNPAYYLASLLPENRLKCLGVSLRGFTTGRLSELSQPLNEFPLVVPAYMTGRWGLLKKSLDEGTDVCGPRTNANTDEVRFVVFQSKDLALGQQVSAILRLRSREGLVMVTQPGPHKLEAWFSTKRMEASQIYQFRKFAAALGAPGSVFINAHPYALPGGTTENGFKIKVIYWNPSAI